jgi:hypothetical protein
LSAQCYEDFTHFQPHSNTTWSGDTPHFISNGAAWLQLNASSPGNSAIFMACEFPDSCRWDIDVRLDFAPSTANQLRLILQCDHDSLADFTGYFIEIGETGNADGIRLFRQNKSQQTLLSSGTPGTVGAEPVSFHLTVTKTATDKWSIFADGILQGTATDNSPIAASEMKLFGISCKYTATRSSHFYFDNLIVQPNAPDVKPPTCKSVVPTGNFSVKLTFDEPLDLPSATKTEHFLINNAYTPLSIIPENQNQILHLILSEPLQNGLNAVALYHLQDTAGNALTAQTVTFSFILIQSPEPFDVVINEIMADPDPAHGLPPTEWIELANTSQKIFDLQFLQLSDASNTYTLPHFLLYPDQFIVVTPDSAAWQNFNVPILSMSDWPSLNNSGDKLTLQGSTTLDVVEYDLSWYHQENKAMGGWSLEKINPRINCLGKTNWSASEHFSGGTPGKINSLHQAIPDTARPYLTHLYPESPSVWLMEMSEPIRATAEEWLAEIEIMPPLPIANFQQSTASTAVMTLVSPPEPGITYELTLGNLQDCNGNWTDSTRKSAFGKPEQPAPLDLLINEIMFNPKADESEFIEILNRSNKYIRSDQLYLANLKDGTSITTIPYKRLLPPDSYWVAADDIRRISEHFSNVNEECLLEVELPAMNDKTDNTTIFWSDGQNVVILDSVQYTDEWHHPLYAISEQEGVSLERVRSYAPTQHASNWMSAAIQQAGGQGTPTRKNSQHGLPASSMGNHFFEIPTPRLSPDMDGYEDWLDITYRFPNPGYQARVAIFDSQGRLVKQLLSGTLIGTSGGLQWMGDTHEGHPATPGIYIFQALTTTPEGKSSTTQKAITLLKHF